MASLVCALALAAALAAEPMILEVDRSGGDLLVSFALHEALPLSLEDTLASGATAEIDYQLRVYARRKVIPDRRVWKGVAKATVTFDAITGRYLCQLIVNGDTTASREVEALSAARTWLRSPPVVTVPVPEGRRDAIIRVRVRAVFSRGTTWLVFPTTDGTDWLELRLEPASIDAGE